MFENPLLIFKNSDSHRKIKIVLNDIYEKLLKNESFTSIDIEKHTESLCLIYKEEGFRHIYSELSKYLLNISLADVQDEFIIILERILDHASKDEVFEDNYTEDQVRQVRLNLLKLYDHIRLDIIRANFIQEIEQTEIITNKLLRKVEDKSKKIKRRIENYQAHSITVLSIFSVLVISFSGITSLELNGLVQLANYSPWGIGFFISLSAFFLFNTTFLLLYTISKIIKKNIGLDKPYFWYFNGVDLIFVIVFFSFYINN